MPRLPADFDAQDVVLSVGKMDDRGQAYINGVLVGETGMNDPYYDLVFGNRDKRNFEKGLQTGENKMAKLMEYLLANGTQEEMKKALSDAEVRELMYKEYGIEEAIKTDKKEEGVSA